MNRPVQNTHANRPAGQDGQNSSLAAGSSYRLFEKVFILSRQEGLTYEEIAKQLGISLDTVKTHMKLALKDIRNAVLVYVAIFFIRNLTS